MKVKFKKITSVELTDVCRFGNIEQRKNALRQIREPYYTAYNIAMNNHRNAAREEDVFSAEEYAEALAWFNRLCDVTDTLDAAVFFEVPPKIKKHFKEKLQ